ncbi:hypothetical protein NL676_009482 [Syzygium grande]|nr:hypothetical protein NL676_009482 [Syzygium grande]
MTAPRIRGGPGSPSHGTLHWLMLAELGFPIHQVVTSLFRRCVETARELIAGLFTVGNDDTPNAALGDDGNSADSLTPRIKVSIEYGMCEMMNDVAQWYHPTDHNSWGFDLEELEASFPQDAVEATPDQVFMELPQWGESESGARDRYLLTIYSLVDKYPEENLPFVTHASNAREGVKVTASTYWKEARGNKIRLGYLRYVHLKRQIVRNGNSFTANRFRIATNPDETGGIREPP